MEKELMKEGPCLFNNLTTYEMNEGDEQREVLFLFGLPIVEALKMNNIVVAHHFFPAVLRALGYEYKTVTLPEYFRKGSFCLFFFTYMYYNVEKPRRYME